MRNHPLLLTLLISIALLRATRLISISKNQQQLAQFFRRLGLAYREGYCHFDNGELHYITLGNQQHTPLLLVHGSPGSLSDYLKLIRKSDLSQRFFIIIPDRPGYGESTLAGGMGLNQQAVYLQVLIRKFFVRKKGLIAGHSFGAALALKLVAEHPAAFKGVVSLAGTIAAPHQKPRWYNYLTRYSPARWLINRRLIHSNREMWSLKQQLPALEEKMGDYDGKLAFLQGDRDMLVSGQSLRYFIPLVKKAKVRVFRRSKMNHFVIWTHISEVEKAIKWADS